MQTLTDSFASPITQTWTGLIADSLAGPIPETGTGLIEDISGLILVPVVAMLYSSPIPVVRDILKKKSTLKYEFLPYVLVWANSLTWTVYFIHCGWQQNVPPFLVNAYGLGLNTAVLLIFKCHITDDTVRSRFSLQVSAAVVFMATLCVISFTAVPSDCSDPSSRGCWWGKVCIIVNCCLFFGPLAIFQEVWQTKSVQYMPVSSILSGLISSSDCAVYFLCKGDVNGLIPNLAGVTLSALQALFYIYVKSNYPQEGSLTARRGSSLVPVVQSNSTSFVGTSVLAAMDSPDDSNPQQQREVELSDTSRKSSEVGHAG
eukprot:TRINITY_DN79198_c0_g1_i1.p1 TRINITY_DN79198_c0_g1~~TRINITY_DN79198_c0_g1_i1.p1  ORF type:complete len:316 (+),score=20.64 TRINITY_DN79198_c0_g1_i1:70-1017(+)